MRSLTRLVNVKQPSHRDTQRKKVYRAENKHSLWHAAKLFDEQGTINYANYVIDELRNCDPALAARHGFDKHYATVNFLKGNGRCFARQRDRSINMRQWGCHPQVIIHELAHIVAGCDHRHHAEFARVYVFLMSISIGKAAGDELARLFNEGRVAHITDAYVQKVEWKRAASAKPKLKPREKFLNAKLNELMFQINKLSGLERNDLKHADVERLIESLRIAEPK